MAGKAPSSIEALLQRFRCADCGYGASRDLAPERCPMCGGSSWEPEAWPTYAVLARERADGRLAADA